MRGQLALVVVLLHVTYYSCQNLGATKTPSRVVHKHTVLHRMMEGYSALKRTGDRAMRRHGGAMSAYYCEGSQSERLLTVWFQPQDILEKAKLRT